MLSTYTHSYLRINSYLCSNSSNRKHSFNHLYSIKISLVLVCSVFISAFILSSSFTFADVVDNVSITIPVSCSFIGLADTPHTASINAGTYASDIGTTNFKVTCNDGSGYALYAIGYSNEEYGNTKMLAIINNELAPTYDINTSTATSGANSAWAMKLIPVTTASSGTEQPYTPTIESDTNGSYSNYHIIPAEYTKVATFTSNTDFVIGSNLQSTYQVYIDNNKPAGTYNGKVKYTLVHPNDVPAPIACNPRGTTIGTNNDTDIVCMQDFAALSASAKTTLINNMVEGTQYTLKDKRDNKEYTISKLADGKVWMTQNLDLDLKASTTYTNLDTDLGWDASTNSYNITSWSPIRSTYGAAPNHIHEWCQGGIMDYESGCEQNNTPESYDPGDLYWNGTLSDSYDWYTYYSENCEYNIAIPSCDESQSPLPTYTTVTGTPTPQYHLGNYYNWPATVASNDASIYGAYNDSTGKYENQETNQSICPAGWTLPYTPSSSSSWDPEGDFEDLWLNYDWSNDISTLWRAPLYFAPIGYTNGYLDSVGYSVNYWMSVTGDDTLATNSGFDTEANVYSVDYDGWSIGSSIRCVARPPVTTFDNVFTDNNKTKVNNYYAMQDLNDSMCNAVSEGQTSTLIDIRDNNVYHVGKLKDGNCWMLDNLALDPTDQTTAANMSELNTNATSAAIHNLLHGGSSTTGWSNTAVIDVDNDFFNGGYMTPRINNSNKDTLVTGYGPASINGQAKVGIYYNYCAASASTYCYDSEYGIDDPYTISDASQDVCPANWRMPTGGIGGNYYNLSTEYYYDDATDRNSLQYNLSASLSGNYFNSSPSDKNECGFWWSSTFKDGTEMIYQEICPSYASSTGSAVRHNGFTMRCLTGNHNDISIH